MREMAGAALVLATGYGIGKVLAGPFARRPGQLRDLQMAIAVLDTEIWHGCSMLPDAMSRAARAVADPAAVLFAETARLLAPGLGAAEAWSRAVDRFYPDSACDEDDRAILLSLGPLLGRSDREDQRRHLQLLRERLAGQEARAMVARQRYERLWSYVGVLSAAAVILVFA
ncbi:MAG TPA: stage III sporulation protein AB [Bacillota bacterium]|nr:stage III sporulation protein AB [Bacillota bacterium]